LRQRIKEEEALRGEAEHELEINRSKWDAKVKELKVNIEEEQKEKERFDELIKKLKLEVNVSLERNSIAEQNRYSRKS
jgi:hypothetical protein